MNRTLLVASLLLVACATSPRAEAPRSSVATPLTAKWVLRGTSAGRLDLTARLTFNSPLQDPVTVSVVVPRGITIAAGEPSLVVAAPAGGGVVDLEYGFSVQGQAAGDLLLTADLQTPAFGVHAKDAYAVGGTQAKVLRAPAVEVTGPNVQLGGKDLGPSTPIK